MTIHSTNSVVTYSSVRVLLILLMFLLYFSDPSHQSDLDAKCQKLCSNNPKYINECFFHHATNMCFTTCFIWEFHSDCTEFMAFEEAKQRCNSIKSDSFQTGQLISTSISSYMHSIVHNLNFKGDGVCIWTQKCSTLYCGTEYISDVCLAPQYFICQHAVKADCTKPTTDQSIHNFPQNAHVDWQSSSQSFGKFVSKKIKCNSFTHAWPVGTNENAQRIQCTEHRWVVFGNAKCLKVCMDNELNLPTGVIRVSSSLSSRYSAGTQLQVQCAENHAWPTDQSIKTVKCGTNGEWESSVEQCPKKCKPEITNSDIQLPSYVEVDWDTSDVKLRSKAKQNLVCKNGTNWEAGTNEQDKLITCDDGRWIANDLMRRCQFKGCTEPETDDENTEKIETRDSWVHEDNVTVSCKTGWSRKSKSTATLTCSDGEWQVDDAKATLPFKCSDQDCITNPSSIKNFQNLRFSNSNPQKSGYILHDRSTKVRCNDNYSWDEGGKDDKEIKCKQGTWQNVPTCKKDFSYHNSDCDKNITETSTNLKFVEEQTTTTEPIPTSNNKIAHNTEVDVVCAANHVWKDGDAQKPKTVKCDNGAWVINVRCIAATVASKSNILVIVAVVVSVVIVTLIVVIALVIVLVVVRRRKKKKSKKMTKLPRTLDSDQLKLQATPEQASEMSKGISIDGGLSETQEITDVVSEQDDPDSE